MSGSRPNAEGHLAEQHLGDRLSALVDGELGHDARERVLAHVATCGKCRAEVDAQRRLKNVFAAAAPPAPSESFLARLQGLPGSGTGTRPGGGDFGDGLPEPFEFPYVQARPVLPTAMPAADGRERGFRIHDVSRHEAERSASRGMRFAVAAAGAVSLAAIALGGVTLGAPATGTDARGGAGSGSNVTPLRTQGGAAVTTPEGQRRRSGGPPLGYSQSGYRPAGDGPMTRAGVSAPLLPGLPERVEQETRRQTLRELAAPLLAGAAAMSPLIRPLESVPPLGPGSWAETSRVRPPELLAVSNSLPAAYPVASPAASSRPAP
ncbi:zf-HC2 domain-containing protein [Streptomyces sp. SHP 1-2]|uniref:zf-HC2 domain-containing protein n=1 Tax=Streptomyces sp. SHP 1-2 TaxID=2769489 RepID=UPI002237933C|nr:zf-HC2 domain-containing protein [Streptomyces sp. SHP 1-2]MCW5253245.1 zf-HC2 domain-containing protein [Streptomyces sp. SHP 1-2]